MLTSNKPFYFVCVSSGKSHSGNQQDAFLLKAILAELQERQEDCVKLKEAVDRLEVCLRTQPIFIFNTFQLAFYLTTNLFVCFIRSSIECSKGISRCVT